MRDFVMRKISRQLTLVVVLALALSGTVYFVVQPLLDRAICQYYEEHPLLTYENTSGTMRSLQGYIDENNVKAEDVAALNVWMRQQPLAIMQVYRQNTLLFDSTQQITSGLHTHTTAHAHTVHETLYPVLFADGEADVSLTVFPEYGVIQTLNKVLLSICGLIFLVIVLCSIRGKLKHLVRLENEVLSIAGGDLQGGISVHGHDELSRLAECVDEMRNSLVAKLRQEEARQQESYEWVTAMSHDLRTPLTMLTGYLEILRRKNTDNETRGYIDKSCDKAAQLKDMSDMLFACFSPNALRKEACEPFSTEALENMVAECSLLLTEKGYTISISPIPQAWILVHPDALKRVMDNVFSNLLKYADRQAPVDVTVSLEEDGCILCVKSSSGMNTNVPSAGLGLVISRNLMENMNGALFTDQEHDVFTYRLVWKQASEGA